MEIMAERYLGTFKYLTSNLEFTVLVCNAFWVISKGYTKML